MLDIVKHIPLLRGLTEAQLELLAPLFEVFACPADQIIFHQDEQAAYLYLLVKGTVALHYKPYDGARIVLTHLHAGDAFGWSSVVGGSVYTCDIRSETAVEAVRLHGRDLRRLCRDHPVLGRMLLDRLAEAVSGRWKDSRDQVQNILKRNVAQRHAAKSK